MRVCWILLGAGFLAVLGFAVVTVVLKGHQPRTTEATEQQLAQNPGGTPPATTDGANRELLPADDSGTANDHLVRPNEVERILGDGFKSTTSAFPPTKELPKDPPAPKPTPKVDNPPPNKPASVDADVAVENRLQTSESDERERLLAVPELRLISDLEIEALSEQEKSRSPQQIAALREQEKILRLRGGNAVELSFAGRLQKALFQDGLKEGLPLQGGANATLQPATAQIVQTLSKNLRDLGFVSVPGTPARVNFPAGSRPGQAATINNASAKDKTDAFKDWCDVNKIEKFRGALSTLLQMLQVEDVPTRLVLVRELAKVNSPGTSVALAKRALVDLSPEVRDAAVAALEKRPSGQYVPILLIGLRYPWPPIADRAALALRKLKPDGAVPKLVALLDQPNPALPVLDKRSKKPLVRELVRLNHLRNCLLCHAASANDKDGLVRGLVPMPGQPLPRLYYTGQAGNFARADTTFLRQDFSVNLPVKAAKPWPDEQRFDFVTRVRALTPDEVAKIPTKPNTNYPQRQAVLYALHGLTGKDAGDSSDKWRELLDIAKDADLDKATKDKKPPPDKIPARTPRNNPQP